MAMASQLADSPKCWMTSAVAMVVLVTTDGRDFAYNKQHRHHHEQVEPFLVGSEKLDDDGCGDNRGGYIYQFVADQDGNDQPAGLAQHVLDETDARVILLAHQLELNVAQRKQRGLGTREETRESHEKYEQN